MPYIKPEISPSLEIFQRVAATAGGRHLDCRVRRCRRQGCCLGRRSASGMLLCTLGMTIPELEDMLNFLAGTIDVATPEQVDARLSQAKTEEEREMIRYLRDLFLYYHGELAREGLSQPLGPPFVEG